MRALVGFRDKCPRGFLFLLAYISDNIHYNDQIQYQRRWKSSGFSTQSIFSIERFVKLSHIEVQQLYKLRLNLEDKNSYRESFSDCYYPFEEKKLIAIQEWIKQWIHPQAHSLVEIESGDGTLTDQLCKAGYHKLIACEPNDSLRKKLEKKVKSKIQNIVDNTLLSLAKSPLYSADFYLLIDSHLHKDDLAILDRLPTDCLLISFEDEYFYTTFEMWLKTNSNWRIVEEKTLISAEIDFCVGEKVFRRRPGSKGIVLYRESLIK